MNSHLAIITQKLRYCLVAFGSAIADWIAFSLVIFLNGNPVIGQAVARIFGGVFSFVLNRHWSFQAANNPLFISFRRFLYLYCVTYLMSISLFGFLEHNLTIHPYGIKLFTDVACFIFNFLISKYYVYQSNT